MQNPIVPLNNLNHSKRQDAKPAAGNRSFGLALPAFTLALTLLFAGCELTGRNETRDRNEQTERNGRFGRDGDDISASPESAPGLNELMIPTLLEPIVVDGVATFDMTIATSTHDFGSGAVTDTISYNEESILGPTLRWRTGENIEIRVTNDLEEPTTAHWHGADVPAEDDGGPHSRIDPGQTWTADFPVIQPAATLWYHPHMMGTSADAEGQLSFEIDADDNGDLNPDLTVNGTLDPFTTVPTGPVRLRLLNGSQARIYQLSISNDSMVKIASDGGLLAAPVPLETLSLGPGDRAEIIIDTTAGPVTLIDAEFGRVLELRTDPQLPKAEHPPQKLTTIDLITPDMIDRERTFHMDEVGDGWGINGKQMDMNRIDETINLNDTERWTITVGDGIHTFHVHQTQFQILEINGEPPPPEDAGWEDTVLVTEEREVVIAARFNTYSNPDIPYMFHCHILDHEDTGMMGQFKVIEN